MNKIMKIVKKASLGLIMIVIVLIINGCVSATYHDEDIKMTKIEKSPQYKDGKFSNYHHWDQPSFGEYLSTGWDFLFGGDQRTPDSRLPRKMADLNHFENSGDNQLNVTWLGHSSLMINIDGYKIMTDPVFEKSVSFFGPSRFNGEVPLNLNGLPEIDIVIISHNHYDHLNISSIEILNEKTTKFIVPLAVGAELENLVCLVIKL